MAVTSEKPVTNNSSAPARPSIPSMKLNRLVSQTRAKRARTNKTDWLRIVKSQNRARGLHPARIATRAQRQNAEESANGMHIFQVIDQAHYGDGIGAEKRQEKPFSS